MALGVNDFVSAGLKEGHKIEDIVAFMSGSDNAEYSDWANKWNSKGFGAEQPSTKDRMAGLEDQFNAEKQAVTTTNVLGFDLPAILAGPATWLTGGAALGAAAVAGGKAALKGIQARSIKNPDVAEAVGNAAKVEATPVDYTVPAVQRKAAIQDAAGVPVAKPLEMTPVQKAQAIAERNRQAGIGVTPPAPAAPGAPAAGPAPVQPPAAPTTVTEAVVTGQSPNQAIQAEIAQQIDAPAGSVPPESGVKKRAAKTQVTFKPGQQLPEGTVFRPDLGNLDRSLYNILGPEHRRNAMEMLNEGKPFGNVEGATLNQSVSDITNKYWKSLQEQIPETILDRGAREAQGVKSSFGNYGSLGKAVKVAGVAGTLMAVADLAKASQLAKEGQYLEASKLAAPAVDPTGMAFAAVNPNETSQMLSNVSPLMGMFAKYMMSDMNGKKEYEQKVGSGRGIAPPSAYAR